MRVRLAGCLALVCALAAPLGAQAQIESREGIALQNQIFELRHQLDALRKQIPTGGAGGSVLGGYQQPTPLTPAPSASGLEAQLLDRVQRLETALRDLRGQVDEANNAREREIQDLNKKVDDLAFRLGVPSPDAGTAAGAGAAATAGAAAGTLAAQGEGAPGTPPKAPAGGTLPTPPLAPPAQPAAKRTPEMVLQQGNAALARHDYAAAEAAAKEVLGDGKGTRATDAQFLLARALAGKRDYSAAAVAYDDAYNRSRSGVHAQDSLLGLARSLTAINEKRAACETLDKLHAEFPAPRADLREPIAQARKSAGCH